jgi:hypothetical protein
MGRSTAEVGSIPDMRAAAPDELGLMHIDVRERIRTPIEAYAGLMRPDGCNWQIL